MVSRCNRKCILKLQRYIGFWGGDPIQTLFQFNRTLHLLFFLNNELDRGEWQLTTINQNQIHFYSFLFQQIIITIILQAKNLTAAMTSRSISFPMEVLLILPPDYCQICPHLFPLIMFLITKICFQRLPLPLRIKIKVLNIPFTYLFNLNLY